jgi:hypothetical protein
MLGRLQSSTFFAAIVSKIVQTYDNIDGITHGAALVSSKMCRFLRSWTSGRSASRFSSKSLPVAEGEMDVSSTMACSGTELVSRVGTLSVMIAVVISKSLKLFIGFVDILVIFVKKGKETLSEYGVRCCRRKLIRDERAFVKDWRGARAAD